MSKFKLSPTFKVASLIALTIAGSSYGAMQFIEHIESKRAARAAANPGAPVLYPAARLDSGLWKTDSPVYEIRAAANPGETCVLVENYEGIDSDCFPSHSPLPTGDARTLTPLFSLESEMWKEDTKYYEYTPQSNPAIRCQIIESFENIDVTCRAHSPG